MTKLEKTIRERSLDNIRNYTSLGENEWKILSNDNLHKVSCYIQQLRNEELNNQTK